MTKVSGCIVVTWFSDVFVLTKRCYVLLDPDMLEIGNGGMSYQEYRAHFSIWALMKVFELFPKKYIDLIQTWIYIYMVPYLFSVHFVGVVFYVIGWMYMILLLM